MKTSTAVVIVIAWALVLGAFVFLSDRNVREEGKQIAEVTPLSSPQPTRQPSSLSGILSKAPNEGAAYTSPFVEDPRLANFVNRKLPLATRVPPDSTMRIPRLKSPTDIRAILTVLNDKEDHPTARNQAMNYLRRSSYRPNLARHLVRLFRDSSEPEVMRRYFIQHLGQAARDANTDARRQWIIYEIEKALTDASPYVRSRALLEFTNLYHPEALHLAERVYLDDQEHSLFRRQAIHALGRFKASQHIPALRTLAQSDEDVDIRIAAIAELGNFRDEKSKSVFLEASGSTHHQLKSAGKVALAKLNY